MADRQIPQGCPTITQLKHEGALARDASGDDPWGERFRIFCRDLDIGVRSPGRDGLPGTSDDVAVPRS